MKWTIRKKDNRWIVKFEGESPMEFFTRGGALAYINDRVFTALGV